MLFYYCYFQVDLTVFVIYTCSFNMAIRMLGCQYKIISNSFRHDDHTEIQTIHIFQHFVFICVSLFPCEKYLLVKKFFYCLIDDSTIWNIRAPDKMGY